MKFQSSAKSHWRTRGDSRFTTLFAMSSTTAGHDILVEQPDARIVLGPDRVQAALAGQYRQPTDHVARIDGDGVIVHLLAARLASVLRDRATLRALGKREPTGDHEN
uniref:Uncharacterized protein n=1 Tax=Anopheles coluzzii TaxID=1518534 RepID=A0A8W7PWX4_ANOCL